MAGPEAHTAAGPLPGQMAGEEHPAEGGACAGDASILSSSATLDLDLVVVGAGPCALALVDRLACRRPDCTLDYAFGFDSVNEVSAATNKLS